MNLGKHNWIGLALLALILASTAWEHFDRAMAGKAQRPPTVMDKAFDEFAECSKIGQR